MLKGWKTHGADTHTHTQNSRHTNIGEKYSTNTLSMYEVCKDKRLPIGLLAIILVPRHSLAPSTVLLAIIYWLMSDHHLVCALKLDWKTMEVHRVWLTLLS